jgi:hypothetical protein
MLRHQLNVLRRRVPSKPMAVADRLLFVWLYRLFLSALNAIAIVQPETIIRLCLPKTRSGSIGDEATQEVPCNDVAKPLDRARKWRILGQGKMRSNMVVVSSIGIEDSAQMVFAQHHDMV